MHVIAMHNIKDPEKFGELVGRAHSVAAMSNTRSNVRSYIRALDTFAAGTRDGRIGRLVTCGRKDAAFSESPSGGRGWINGRAVGPSTSGSAHLYRSYD